MLAAMAALAGALPEQSKRRGFIERRRAELEKSPDREPSASETRLVEIMAKVEPARMRRAQERRERRNRSRTPAGLGPKE
jgi:hypothetical protein